MSKKVNYKNTQSAAELKNKIITISFILIFITYTVGFFLSSKINL